MLSFLLQAAGLAAGTTFAFLIDWRVGGIAAAVGLVFVGLAAEGH